MPPSSLLRYHPGSCQQLELHSLTLEQTSPWTEVPCLPACLPALCHFHSHPASKSWELFLIHLSLLYHPYLVTYQVLSVLPSKCL